MHTLLPPLPGLSVTTTAPAAPAFVLPLRHRPRLRPCPHPRRLSPASPSARSFRSEAERSGLADLFDTNRSEARHRPQFTRAPVLPDSAWRRILIAGPASPRALTRATDASLLSASTGTQNALACCSECQALSRAFRAREARRQADALAGRPVQRPVPRPFKPPLRSYPPIVPLAPAVLYNQPAVPVHTVEAQQLFRRRVAQAGKLLLGVSLLSGGAYAYVALPGAAHLHLKPAAP